MSMTFFKDGDGPERAVSFRLDAFLPARLCQLGEHTRDGLMHWSAIAPGLGPAGWQAIMILGEHGTLTARRIISLGGMHKTKVSRALAALEARRLVERTVNLNDFRESFVALTPLGREHHAAMARASLTYEAELLAVLTTEERAALAVFLHALGARANALRDGGMPRQDSNEND